MLTKSRRALAASALALAAASGSVAVIRAMSPSDSVVSPSAMPLPAGPAATATVPRGAGSAEGSAAAGGTVPGGQAATTLAPLARSAGQGDPGPLPVGALPADGAVPGASPAIQAQAAARAAITALPHSPQLLAALGQSGTGTGAPSPAATSTAATPPDTPSAAATSQAAMAAAASLLRAGAPGASTPTAPGTSTPTAPGTSTPTAPGTGTPTVPGTGTPTAPGTGTPTAPGTSTPTSPASSPPSSSPATPPQPTATPSPTPTKAKPPKPPRRLPGLDVAAFQHPVSSAHPGGAPIYWNTVGRAGYKYAAVKGTEGDYYVNRYAAGDVKSAKAAGLDVAPYHFGIPNASGGAAQAQFAVEYSGYAPGPRTLPLMLDIEYNPYVSFDHTNECYGLSAARMTAWLAGFVTEARVLTGQYPVIYTTADWWDTCTGRSAAFGADPMWIAAYGFSSPPMPPGWKAWTFWQYTSTGSVPGVATRGTTDLDTFSPATVGLISPGAQSAVTGARVSLAVASLGAMAGEVLTYSAAGLPPGLSLGPGGTITGIIGPGAAVKTPVTYRVTITVRNAAGATSAATFTWKVRPA